MNKKGVEINVTTIIIVILAILALVIIALYFTHGMRGLWGRITPYPGAYDVTQAALARDACSLYCSANDKVGFCEYTATLERKDEKGNVIGRDEKKCWEDPINAHRTSECKAVGFNKEICEEEG